jgi:spore coat protein H
MFSALIPQAPLMEQPDVSRFIEFGEVVAAATGETFLTDMDAYIDIDQLVRYMAVDRAIKNWDGITAFYWRDRPHNLYWYHDVETTGLFHIIPWDLDKTLWEYDPYMDPEQNTADRQVPDWNVLPASCSPIPVWYGSVYVFPVGCDNFMNLLAVTSWNDFALAGEELLGSVFQYDDMDDKVTRWAEQIAPLVDADPLLNRTSWESVIENFRDILEKSIRDFEVHLEQGYIEE